MSKRFPISETPGQRLLSFVLAVVLGSAALVVAGMTGRLSDLLDLPFPGLGLYILEVVMAFQVGMVLHEFGHLIGARLVGFQPRHFAAMLLQITWENGKARLRAPKGALRWSGLMLVNIARTDHLERRIAGFTAGGPATSLVLGLALGAIGLQLAGSPLKGFAFLLLLAANFTLIVGLLTLIPYRSGGYLSDGARLLRLWLGGQAAARDAALWAIISLVNADTRPREVPQLVLERALAPRDNSLERLQAEALAAMVALDRGELPAALARMKAVMAQVNEIPVLMRPNYYLEAAYVAARHEGDAAKAGTYLAQTAGGIGIQPWHRARAASAVALAGGEYNRALTLAREGLQALAGQRVTGLVLFERDLLEDLAARAQAGDAH